MLNHNEILSGGSIDNYSNFMGEVIPDNYLILYCQNRDSDCLERSNFECVEKYLSDKYPAVDIGDYCVDQVRIDRINHWGVGWVEYLSIDSSNPELLKDAEDIERALADYPVFDEEHFTELEAQEANEIWQNCYDEKDRIDYIRKFRSQFEFMDYQDLRSVIRGEYFNGYASELIQ